MMAVLPIASGALEAACAFALKPARNRAPEQARSTVVSRDTGGVAASFERSKEAAPMYPAAPVSRTESKSL
jgi:hypothetical protein